MFLAKLSAATLYQATEVPEITLALKSTILAVRELTDILKIATIMIADWNYLRLMTKVLFMIYLQLMRVIVMSG